MEETAEVPVKRRGWPKGKSRKPTPSEAVLPLPTIEAPIHVRIRLKNYAEEVEFGCARRTVENGFHVFIYPSKRDPYRETRREFAVSEIAEIEITEARPVYQSVPAPVQINPTFVGVEPYQAPSGRPVIHNAKEYALSKMKEKVEAEAGARLDAIPGITFGDSLA